MTYLDTIKEKRASEALAKEQIQKHQTSIGATLRSGKAVAEEVAKQAAKSRSEKQAVVFDKSDLAKSQDVFTLVECIKELGTILKPEGIDWKPVESALATLNSQVAKLPTEYPQAPAPVESVTVKNLPDLEPTLKRIIDTLDNLKVSPVFEPKITVKAPTPAQVSVDTSPISEVLEAHFNRTQETGKQKIDIDNLKAQDIDNDAGNMQYVGLLAPDGLWCIIENDIKGNSLRYRYGRGNYARAWAGRVSSSYRLIDEAINEIRS